MRETSQHAIANPVLYSEMVYQTICDLRQAEQQQIERLRGIQEKGAKLFHLPKGNEHGRCGLTKCDERVGVVGLVVDLNMRVGYVTRLKAGRSRIWHVANNLPFREVHVRDAMLSLLHESVGFDQALPELLAFNLSDTLGDGSRGGSMDITALMAVIDTMNAEPQRLSATTAVVSPGHEGKLVASDGTKEKLRAFVREFGSGTLLIRHSYDRDAADFDDYFDCVWDVTSYEDLSEWLAADGLLDNFLKPHRLTSSDALAIGQYLDYLQSSDSLHGAFESFLTKVQPCVDAETPLEIKLRLLNAREDLCRNSGRFIHALGCCEERVILVADEPDLIDYDETIMSANRLGSALIDAHRFTEAVAALEMWHTRVSDDPRICKPDTRTFLWNTLARAKAIIGSPDSDSLFQKSLSLQAQIDVAYIARTTNYRIHALLRNGRLDDAEIALRALDHFPIDAISDRFLGHLLAELDRRRGKTYSKDFVQQLVDNCDSECHSTAFRFQSIARQRRQDAETSRFLFVKAAEILIAGIRVDDQTNIKRFLAGACRLGAATVSEDTSEAEVVLDDLLQYVDQPSLEAIRDHYKDSLALCRANVNLESAECLFELIPNF